MKQDVQDLLQTSNSVYCTVRSSSSVSCTGSAPSFKLFLSLRRRLFSDRCSLPPSADDCRRERLCFRLLGFSSSRGIAIPASARSLSTTGPRGKSLSPLTWLQIGLYRRGNSQSKMLLPMTVLKFPRGPKSHGFSPGLV